MNDLNLFVPITKIDAARRLVYGVVTAEKPDVAGEVCDYASTKPLYQKWSEKFATATDGKSLGNLRAMHGSVAAGKLVEIAFNDDAKQVEICGKVVDSAILIQNDTSTNYHTPYIGADGAAALPAGTYTMSIYAKAGSAGGWLMLGTSQGPGAYFNLNAGTVGSTASGATGSIAPGPNGYYRCAVTFSFPGGALYFALVACSSNLQGNFGQSTFTAASEGIYVYGGQVEALGFASSYIPTTTVTASRSADSFYVPWASATFTAMTKMVMLAEVDNGRLLGCGFGGLLCETNGPSASTNNGSAALATSVNAWTTSNKIVVCGSPSGRTLSANGNAATSDSNALVSAAPTRIYVGQESGGSNCIFGDLAQLAFWNVVATATQAATLSGGS